MSNFVLIGGPFEIYESKFNGDQHLFNCVLGGKFEMPDSQAKAAVLDGAALLPEAMYDELGITAEEEKQWPNPKKQTEAPAAFQAKLLAARIALHNYRAELAQEA